MTHYLNNVLWAIKTEAKQNFVIIYTGAATISKPEWQL